MENAFVIRLKKILKDRISDENFGVRELASTLNLSRSQLNRSVRKHFKKSPSQLIREYRLETAYEMLIETDFTSSEIAYKVGFNSASYFNSSFSKLYGYTPGEAKVRNSIKEHSEFNPHSTSNKTNYTKWAVVVAIIVLIGFSSYTIISSSNTKIDQKENLPMETIDKNISIAVLPFKNLSDSKEDEYLAYGIREDITSKISKIQNVLVKSPNTIEEYLNLNSSINDIGKDLKVDYIINGSVQNFKERIKIIIHIIDINKDELEISRSFEGAFDDIFDLEKEISESIAAELDLVITPEQLRQIKKQPTENADAYKLYMKGRYFYYIWTVESSELAYKYYQECIKIDPEFAMAYVGLADLIDSSNWPWISSENYKEMKQYALKAMEIDNTIPDTHKLLAKIHMRQKHNWDAAEREYRLALKIDPEHVETNIEYGVFLATVRGDFAQAQKLFSKVDKINPLSLYNLAASADAFIDEGNFNEARRQTEKAKELTLTGRWPHWVYWNSFVIYLSEDKPDLAVEELKTGWSYYPEVRIKVGQLMDIYAKDGVNGIFQWQISLFEADIDPVSEDENINAMDIAELYSAIGNEQKALEYINMAVKNNHANLYQMKYKRLLFPLRDNPKFLNILKELNLGRYKDQDFLE